jgi:hypothetical protein
MPSPRRPFYERPSSHQQGPAQMNHNGIISAPPDPQFDQAAVIPFQTKQEASGVTPRMPVPKPGWIAWGRRRLGR